MSDLQQNKSINTDALDLTADLKKSGLLPQKQELHEQIVSTLKQVLPHLGTDESKIVSALIILALKLEGIIGKEISEKDSNLIDILRECVIGDEEKRDTALKIAENLTKASSSEPKNKRYRFKY